MSGESVYLQVDRVDVLGDRDADGRETLHRRVVLALVIEPGGDRFAATWNACHVRLTVPGVGRFADAKPGMIYPVGMPA